MFLLVTTVGMGIPILHQQRHRGPRLAGPEPAHPLVRDFDRLHRCRSSGLTGGLELLARTPYNASNLSLSGRSNGVRLWPVLLRIWHRKARDISTGLR